MKNANIRHWLLQKKVMIAVLFLIGAGLLYIFATGGKSQAEYEEEITKLLSEHMSIPSDATLEKLSLEECRMEIIISRPQNCAYSEKSGVDLTTRRTEIIDFTELHDPAILAAQASEQFGGMQVILGGGAALSKAFTDIEAAILASQRADVALYGFVNQDPGLTASGIIEKILTERGITSRQILKTCLHPKLTYDLTSYGFLMSYEVSRSDLDIIDEYKKKFCRR